MGNLTNSATLGLDAFEGASLELRANATEDDLQTIIRAVYKQVLGNVHVMDSEGFASAEAQLRNGDISVRGFVNLVAQSSLYQSLFFHQSSQYRFIELNFKHLLGRPPQDQAEIAEHVAIYSKQGYEAEINSYTDSSEYIASFGENVVPYPRSIQSQTGFKNETFNRMFSLLRGSATSDRGGSSRLIASLGANLPTPIETLATGNGAAYANTGKRFQISYSTSKAAARLNKMAKQTITINYSEMSQILQVIYRRGGEIVSISEVA
ncbi:MAG: phycobilisome rod-core linker polypeptide [Cyanobacteria bacterium SBLK]|nr:phycobilisome rod-core linker polypeptide [Cyanobacteria bacterium SBLK]